jgi:hypothetical protein
VIERERRGDYLGETVQIVPHFTDALQEWIERVAKISVDETKEEPDAALLSCKSSLTMSSYSMHQVGFRRFLTSLPFSFSPFIGNACSDENY